MRCQSLGKLRKVAGAVKEHGGETVLRLLEAGKQGKGERLVLQVQAGKVLSNQTWSSHRGQKDRALIMPNILCRVLRVFFLSVIFSFDKSKHSHALDQSFEMAGF